MANSLHRQLASRILLHIRTSDLREGAHLTETSLQELLGTSRGPIRAALTQLSSDGLLVRRPNRGFFVGNIPANITVTAKGGDDERVYLSIAEDRLTGRLPTTVSENEIMRQYGIPRSQLRRILSRIAREGWIERREGRGWTFAALIDSADAYQESYDLRCMLEPAGLLSKRFRLDADTLTRLREQQEFVLAGGWTTLSQFELFETNSRFHSGLASMSGNRFLLAAIESQNQLRRLVQYRQVLHRERVRDQSREHLEILSLLVKGQREQAARRLREHLEGAKALKAGEEAFPG